MRIYYCVVLKSIQVTTDFPRNLISSGLLYQTWNLKDSPASQSLNNILWSNIWAQVTVESLMISTISIQDTTLNTHLDSNWSQSLTSHCRASGLLGAFALMGLCVGALPRMGRILWSGFWNEIWEDGERTLERPGIFEPCQRCRKIWCIWFVVSVAIWLSFCRKLWGALFLMRVGSYFRLVQQRMWSDWVVPT